MASAAIYTPAELLATARIAIANAQWFKAGTPARRASLEAARYLIQRARIGAGLVPGEAQA